VSRAEPKRVQVRKTPIELWTGHRPSVSRLRIFGSDCFIHKPKKERKDKFDSLARPGVFIGYPASGQGWRVLDLERRKVIVSRDVSFNEGRFEHRGPMLMTALGFDANYMVEIEEKDEDEMLGEIEDESLMRAMKDISRMEAKQSKASRSVQPEPESKSSEEEKEVSEPVEQRSVASEGVSAATVPLATNVSQSAPSPLGSSTTPVVREPRAAKAQAVAKMAQHSSTAAKNPKPSQPKSSVAPTAAAAAASSSSSAAPKPIIEKRVTRSSHQALTVTEPERKGVSAESAAAHAPSVIRDPLTIAEALSGRDRAKWLPAIKEEMRSHFKNHTWTLTRLPKNHPSKPMGNMWVFKTKVDVNGVPVRWKARLVGKGFTQKAGVDYHETYSPTLMYKVLRLILILSAEWDYELKQMDVETAFLNARMEEEVYMKQPEGFEQRGVDGTQAEADELVCRLNKTLYGTKQASKAWNDEVNSFLVSALGYSRCESDPCLYFRVSRSGRLMLLGLFVDDTVSAYSIEDSVEWIELKSKFMAKYTVKDLGDALALLGMRVTRDRQARIIRLDQATHVKAMLAALGMEECSRRDTPEQVGLKLSEVMTEVGAESAESASVSLSRTREYQSIVGKLHYIAQSTRPDISHAVNQLSRFQANPSEIHMQAAMHCVRYLRGTPSLPIEFG
ncbi:MAG: reverse transcriptase domain-containing protein, partial [Candidatus Pacebacteria bacterium]|nr:reverse transcriptase domain-containing protein [Candidatus Paceibacterota bacterium]